MERHFDNRHFGKKDGFVHRPMMGARFVHRPMTGASFINYPAVGRYVTINRERLWLSDGVLYKVIRSRNTITYIVVGYI